MSAVEKGQQSTNEATALADIDQMAAEIEPTLSNLKKLLALYKQVSAASRIEIVAQKILEEDPSDFMARRALVHLYVERSLSASSQKVAAEASRLLKDAESLPGTTAVQLLEVARYYSRMKDEASARRVALRAVEAIPEEAKPSARLVLAQVYLDHGQPAAARNEIAEILPQLSRPSDLIRAAVALEKLKQNKMARSAAARAVPLLRPVLGSPDDYIILAEFLMRNGEVAVARGVMRRAGSTYFREARIALRFHEICFNLAINDLAKFHAQSVLSKDPYNPLMQQRLALLHLLDRAPIESASAPPVATPVKRLLALLKGRRSAKDGE
ncbi:lipopolysaccharide assembly protein LapB [Acidisoma sp. L85]|uniref:tetratricopeptide repeat protein n=1 Tax=Acidisoma sp. L85 TaxID=1641850 RepID=UPI00131A8296|nr:hypothetical protein [Acidisoma sp. L85]